MVALSAVVAGNDKARIDSRYFGREAIALDEQIRSLPHTPLGELCEGFRKGIFDIKADSYVEVGGVPFVRVGDLRSGLIDFESVAQITTEAHFLEHKTALGLGDIILSKTAYAAAALVTIDQCNASQDTIAAHLSSSGRNRFRSGYIVSYLNSRPGRTLVAREFQGNVQEHLGLGDAAALPIPSFGQALHDSVHDLMIASEDARKSATAALAEAETLLLDALGLRGWSPPEPLTYTRSAAAVAATGRLDPQYFMPAKFDMVEALERLPGAPLGASFQPIKDMVDPNRGNPATVVRNYDLTHALQPVLDATTETTTFADIDSQKKRLLDSDLAVSRLRSYLKEIAVVRVTDDIPAIGSSEFFVLRKLASSVAVSAEALMVYLKSAPVQTILKWCQDGSQHPRFAERDLMAIPLPDVVTKLNGQLTMLVSAALDQRARSLALLEAAKRSVEIAIEAGETAALAYVATQVTVDADGA